MEAEAATDSNSIAPDEETDRQRNSTASAEETDRRRNSTASAEETDRRRNSTASAEETDRPRNSTAPDEETDRQSNSTAPDEETDRQSISTTSDEETDWQPSLNTLAIVKKATTPANISSIAIQDWRSVLYNGVLLENNTQKFWVDEKHNKNCFLVLPKRCDIDQSNKGSCLSIDWSKKGSGFSWITEKENWFSFHSAVNIDVIKLEKLSWLFIEGRFKTGGLSPNTTYEVAFKVKLIGTDNEWQYPVELELVLPNETKQTCTEDLKQQAKGEWINLRAGKFKMGPETVGTIYFALHETFDPKKSGLILRGVLIQPRIKQSKKV